MCLVFGRRHHHWQCRGCSQGFRVDPKRRSRSWAALEREEERDLVPSRATPDPFPADVDRVDNAGVKLLGAPIGSKEFTTDFVKKKLKALDDVCKLLREVDNAQVEFGLFRGCLSYNKINHLLRTCPPDLLQEALVKFDDHFQNMVAEILRVLCLTEDQWEQASLPVEARRVRCQPNESDCWARLCRFLLLDERLGRRASEAGQHVVRTV